MLDEKDLQAIAKLMDEKIGTAEARMTAMMEAYFDPKFALLADGIKLVNEKQVPTEAIDDIDDRIDILEATIRLHAKEIAKLKKAQ